MTEQQRINAIIALTKLLYDHTKIKNLYNAKQWQDLDKNDVEALMDSVVNALHHLYSTRLLEGRWIYINMTQQDWDNASDEERCICDDAAMVMKEVIEDEFRQYKQWEQERIAKINE
jgi:hypothetical protein